ncbi:MAG: sulfotransferase family 2 domain-containing protein [Pseudomonadota bacterium]
MILSRGRRYIFVHIPKTGGTSLALALESKAMADDVMLGDTPKAIKRRGRVKGLKTSGRLWKHSRLTDLYGLVDQEEMETFFVFTLVRNPWDRAVSYYHWLKQQNFDHPAVRAANTLDFSGFLADAGTQAAFSNDRAAAYVSDKNGTDRCDLYLRLEHLDEDVTRLEAALDLKLGQIPHENRSQRGAYRGYYSDADAAFIRRLFADDIARFDYTF